MRIFISLIVWVCLLPLQVSAQSIYDLRWQQGGIDYAGFMIYFDEGDIYMRVGYSVNGSYNLVHTEYQYLVDEEANDFVMMESTESYYMQSISDNQYVDFHLLWIRDDQEWIGPIAATEAQILNDDYDNMVMVQFTELQPTDLTEEYLQWFYTPEDQDYYTLLAAASPEPYQPPTQSAAGSMQMHLVIAANTAIGDIGASTQVDLQNLTSEFEGIAAALGMSCRKNIVAGDDFNKDYLLQTLYGLQPGPNDIVVFLYSGHGFRFADQQDRFPMLDMRKSLYIESNENTYIGLSEVYQIIEQKGARLNLVLGDCCNENIGVPKVAGSSFISARSTLNANVDKLANLFLNAQGNIIGAGAVEGEFAIGNNAIGGYFTSSFINSIREEVSRLKEVADPRWEHILEKTVQGTLAKSQICQQCSPQNAFFFETVE